MANAEERRVRRSLAKLGFRLLKSRRRVAPTIDDRGRYAVQRLSDGRFVAGVDFSLTLTDCMSAIVVIRRGGLQFDTAVCDQLTFDPSLPLELLTRSMHGETTHIEC
jgi:hypothetical protein